jgi:predicted DNA-binding protein with PD1-like motif
MKYTQTTLNRVFILRLEQDEILHEIVEQFAKDHGISAAVLWAVGGADIDSRLVVGPRHRAARPVTPMFTRLPDAHEIAGVGTLFPDAGGTAILHMHIAAGRRTKTITGCVRAGVKVWQVLEIVLLELGPNQARRMLDSTTGFKLLDPTGGRRVKRKK